MLVFSRNEGDGVSFPELDMAIEVLKIQGSRVRIGIKASEEIRVLRSELLGKAAKMVEPDDQEARHALRNKLNMINLGMEIARKHIERGDISKAELALRKVISTLQNNAEKPDAVKSDEPGQTRESSTFKAPSVKHKNPTSNNSLSTTTPRIKVLLVEDNHNEGNLLAEILSMNHVDVRVVRDGAEALKSLKSNIPDVVLLDMNMPHLDGKATIEQIRKDQALHALRVYAVTGSNRTELGVKICQDEGVNEWFQKPVQPRSLIKALNSLRSSSSA